jgi:16S rRNA G527 N7-methylase RsmG
MLDRTFQNADPPSTIEVRMHPARIAELLAPFLAPLSSDLRSAEAGSGDAPAVLSPAQLQSISTYIDILQHWNARINLTAIRDPEDIVPRHFGESLFAARYLFPPTVSVGTAAPGCQAGQSSAPSEAQAQPSGQEPGAEQGGLDHGRAGRAGQYGAGAGSTSTHVSQSTRGRAAHQGRVTDQEEDDRALAREVPPPEQAIGVAAQRRKSAAHRASRGSIGTPEQAAEQRKKITVADVGSGPGFPGIPIKLWAPEISLTLIESNHKKATFLREIARALTLTDINIRNVRAESLPERAFDLVTLRAVERFETILSTAASLVAPGGRLALLIGSAQLPAARTLLPSLNWSEPIPIPASRLRLLAVAVRDDSTDCG